MDFISEHWGDLFRYTGFANLTTGHLVMILLALVLIAISIIKEYEPIILLPLAFGILIGNIPSTTVMKIGIYEEGSILYYLNFGIRSALFPSLLLLGVGAMTDFSSILSNPKLLFVGLAGQLGIFLAFIIAVFMGFTPGNSGAIGLIGAADVPASIFLSSKLAPELIAPIAISAVIFMSLVSFIQPPIMKMMTTRKERLIRMKPQRTVTRKEKIIFPVIGLLIICSVVPASIPLLGMFFLGNLLKESGVTNRLSETLKTVFLDIVIILTAITLGASSQATTFFSNRTLVIFIIGAISFIFATFSGILIIKIMNVFLKDDNKINPLIGNSGVSALPYSARVSQKTCLEYDNTNHVLMHAFGPNTAAVIGSAIAAGILLTFFF